jgi:hypothetical protein
MVETATHRDKWLLAALLLLGCLLFLTGVQWGLPSRATDEYLFGKRTPWTGAQILALAPQWEADASRGADVAAHPLLDRDHPITLNQTDSQRAAIVRRYRLYSDQPDEMITLRALAQIKPAKWQFDPKLYQYGGLWVYPIGGLLKLASLFHLVRLTPDLSFYLDHPEEFGRIYVVMRLYSVAWGLAGVVVMFLLVARISGSRRIGTTAAICYMLLPTVINGAHEAKPHLAGAVLGLIAIDFATRPIRCERKGWAIAVGVACGAAASMVLSGWLLIGILPVMAFVMSKRTLATPGRADCLSIARPMIAVTAMSCGAAALTYTICNPYVILHLLGDRTVLQSNLENSAAMYRAPASINGMFHGIRLLFESGSTVIFFGLWVITSRPWRRQSIAWLLLAATIPGICIFLMHATDKPGEYARFALPIDVLLVLGATMGITVCRHAMEQRVMAIVLCLMLLPLGLSYVLNYGRQTLERSTRLIVADRLRTDLDDGARVLAVDAEPAPYCLPPADLFRWKLVLLPPMSPLGAVIPADADARIDPVDRVGKSSATVSYLIPPLLLPTPISWAGKPFRIQVRSGDAAAAKGLR